MSSKQPMSPELARLVEQGRARQAEQQVQVTVHQARLQSLGYRHLRVALGAYRGSAIKRLILALMLLGPVAGGLALYFHLLPFETALVALMLPWPLLFAYIFTPPLASKAVVADEERWATSRPFELRGYFELLEGEPVPLVNVTYDIAWRPGVQPPEPALVQTACSAIDPGVRIDAATPHTMRVTSTAISGATGIRINRRHVYRNHRIPRAVHNYIDTVWSTLHASYPIAHVTVTRDGSSVVSGQELLAIVQAARGAS